MELDTRSAHTIVNERVWRALGCPYLSSAPQLTAYGGFPLPVRGSAQVVAKFRSKEQKLPLIIVDRNSPSLLGRTWMQAFSDLRTWLDNAFVNSIETSNSMITALCGEFAELFDPSLGKLRGYQAHIYVMPDAQFRFFKPRPVAFSMKTKFESDLNRL